MSSGNPELRSVPEERAGAMIPLLTALMMLLELLEPLPDLLGPLTGLRRARLLALLIGHVRLLLQLRDALTGLIQELRRIGWERCASERCGADGHHGESCDP